MSVRGAEAIIRLFSLWFCLYLSGCGLQLLLQLLLSLHHLALHVAAAGALVCVYIAIRLPPPAPDRVDAILGDDPARPVVRRCGHLDVPHCDHLSVDASLAVAKKKGASVVHLQLQMDLVGRAAVIVQQEERSEPEDDEDLCRESRSTASLDSVLEATDQRQLGIVLEMPDQLCGQNADRGWALVQQLLQTRPHLTDRLLLVSDCPILLYLVRHGCRDICTALRLIRRPACHSSTSLPSVAWRLWAFCVDLFVWDLLGVSSVVLAPEDASKSCVVRWKCRGVRPIVDCINDSLWKAHAERYLAVTYLTDTLDRIHPDRLLLLSPLSVQEEE